MTVLLWACAGAPVLDSSPEGDSDADTDTDTDTDTDADADSDTDLPDWFLFTTRLDAGYEGGALVDYDGHVATLEASFYPSGWDEDPATACTARYDIVSQAADGTRWTLGLEHREGDCWAASNLDPMTDLDHLIVGVAPLTWELEEDLVDVFGPSWEQLAKPFVMGAHMGVDTTRENGWAWVLEVDEDMRLVPGDNCAVSGATCLEELPDRAVLRTEPYYKLFAADLE